MNAGRYREKGRYEEGMYTRGTFYDEYGKMWCEGVETKEVCCTLNRAGEDIWTWVDK